MYFSNIFRQGQALVIVWHFIIPFDPW